MFILLLLREFVVDIVVVKGVCSRNIAVVDLVVVKGVGVDILLLSREFVVDFVVV